MPRFKRDNTVYQSPRQRAEDMVASEMAWIDAADEVWGVYDEHLEEGDEGYVPVEDRQEMIGEYETPQMKQWLKEKDEAYRQRRIEELTTYFEEEDKKRLSKERLKLIKGNSKKGG